MDRGENHTYRAEETTGKTQLFLTGFLSARNLPSRRIGTPGGEEWLSQIFQEYQKI